jgi:hypothetical protein
MVVIMLTKLKSFFTKKQSIKKIAFIDGDQEHKRTLAAYLLHVVDTDTETHLIRAGSKTDVPRAYRHHKEINQICLKGYTSGKEIVDKYIGAYIQKAITEGYSHITVISSDYDFIDIFKMAVVLNPEACDVTFKMIVPNALGRVAKLPAQIANIEIVKL